MRLSYNEIRARAARFADEWKDARYERGESQTFYNEFFDVFGVSRRRVASFEEPVKKLSDKYGFIDLFWKGVLLVEQKSAGGNLTKAKTQALDYFPGLKEAELPRHILVSDFQTFQLTDLDEGTEVPFKLKDLPKHVERFGFILGVEKRTFREQDPVNIKASEVMGRLHDALEASGYVGHELEQFLVRLLFCVNAGVILQRFAGAKVQQRCKQEGPRSGAFLLVAFQLCGGPSVDGSALARRDRRFECASR